MRLGAGPAAALLLALAPSLSFAADGADEAYRLMLRDPAAAEAAFRQGDTDDFKVGLAVDLRLFLDQTELRHDEIQKLLSEVAAKEHPGFKLKSYDGSVKGLAVYIAATAGELPCGLFERYPDLVGALRARFGSSMDNFLPRTTCRAPDYDVPKSVSKFLAALHAYDGDAFNRCTGTLRYSYYREALYDGVIVAAAPGALSDVPDTPPLDEVPLQRWAYGSLWNWRAFLAVKAQFLDARRDLADYYRNRFHLDDQDAVRAAHAGLWLGQTSWTRQVQPMPSPLRRAVLEGDDDAVERLAAERSNEGGSNDPLLLVAVEHPRALRALLSHGAAIDEPNFLGKTALMSAAQFDRLDAITLLLEAGAPVNAATRDPAEIAGNDVEDPNNQWSGCGFYRIAHGRRTALMYAAANGSLPTIKALLRAGADRALLDSRGRSAREYLLGAGPVPKNPLLTDADLKEAEALLSP